MGGDHSTVVTTRKRCEEYGFFAEFEVEDLAP
jgi:hypothetical protein